jgi:hypothetical protein
VSMGIAAAHQARDQAAMPTAADSGAPAYCTSRFRLEFGYRPIWEIRLAMGDSYLVKFVHHIPHQSRAIFYFFSI